MASDKGGEPSAFNASVGYSPNTESSQQYPPSISYPPQNPVPPYATGITTGQPSAGPQEDPAKGYPSQPPPGYSYQGGQLAYPPQGAPPAYSQHGAPAMYPPQGAAPGNTTQNVPMQYYSHAATHTTTTVITQQPGTVMVGQAPPPDNIVLSVVSMFCCFFIGIFALLRSLKSRELYRLGDFAGAAEMGMSARKLAVTGIVVAICTYVFIVVLRIILTLAL